MDKKLLYRCKISPNGQAAPALDNALTECLLKQGAASQVHAVITPVSISLFETRAGILSIEDGQFFRFYCFCRLRKDNLSVFTVFVD